MSWVWEHLCFISTHVHPLARSASTPDFPGGSDGQSVCLQCGRPGFDPWVGKIPWRRKWQPTPVLLPGKSHRWRSLVSYSPWGHRQCYSISKTTASALLTTPKPLTGWITNKQSEILQKMRIPDHLTCLLRNLYAGHEATIRTRHGTTNWFKTGKKSTSRLYIVTLLI